MTQNIVDLLSKRAGYVLFAYSICNVMQVYQHNHVKYKYALLNHSPTMPVSSQQRKNDCDTSLRNLTRFNFITPNWNFEPIGIFCPESCENKKTYEQDEIIYRVAFRNAVQSCWPTFATAAILCAPSIFSAASEIVKVSLPVRFTCYFVGLLSLTYATQKLHWNKLDHNNNGFNQIRSTSRENLLMQQEQEQERQHQEKYFKENKLDSKQQEEYKMQRKRQYEENIFNH